MAESPQTQATLLHVSNYVRCLIDTARKLEFQLVDTTGVTSGSFTPTEASKPEGNEPPAGAVPQLSAMVGELDRTLSRSLREVEKLRTVLGIPEDIGTAKVTEPTYDRPVLGSGSHRR